MHICVSILSIVKQYSIYTDSERDIKKMGLGETINLKKMAVSFTVTACGASANGARANALASYGAMKQEFNAKVVHA